MALVKSVHSLEDPALSPLLSVSHGTALEDPTTGNDEMDLSITSPFGRFICRKAFDILLITIFSCSVFFFRMARTNSSGKWGGADMGGPNPGNQNNAGSGFNQLGGGPNSSGQV